MVAMSPKERLMILGPVFKRFFGLLAKVPPPPPVGLSKGMKQKSGGCYSDSKVWNVIFMLDSY